MSLENKEGNPLFGKDFLKTWYLADDEIKTVADVAGRLAALYKNGASTKVFDGGAAVTVTNSGKETGIELAAGFGCALSGLSLFEKTEGILPIPQRWQPCLPRGAQML